MEYNAKLARTGYITFSLTGICTISSGVIVSILQERYGFNFSTAGTLLSTLSTGNMIAAFAAGVLPAKIGAKRTVAILCSGFFIGYLMMAFFGSVAALTAAFLLAGFAKGCTITNATVLVGNNVPDRTKGLSMMHAGYAMAAMLCPFLISGLLHFHPVLPMIGIAALGGILWLTFLTADLPNERTARDGGEKTDLSFLKSGFFWLVTGLIFCQNAAETAVTGWLVTYYKTNGILSGNLSAYSVTIMWGATLAGRLMMAFVFHVRNTFKALALMGIGCSVMYLGLVLSNKPLMAICMLFFFAFFMGPVNPVGMAGVGKMMNKTSVGILIPVAGTGHILMPWIIGVAADRIGLQVAMALNLIPCIGIFVLSTILRLTPKKQAAG